MTLPLLPNNAMTFTESQHGNEVLEKLMQQRENGRWCDVILHVAEQEYNAHRCVLSACSPFFYSIFKAGKTVKEQLNICSDQPDVFPNLLGYMYTGSVLIDTTNVSELLKLANKLLLTKLKDHCAEYLERYLDENNCLTVYDMAKRFKLESLFHATENIIACNLDKIISGKEVQEYHQAKLETLITSQSLNFSDEQKLLLIANWVAAKLCERQSSVSVLLTWIDWLNVDFSYICWLIQEHELFSDESMLCILMEILSEQNLLPKEMVPKFLEIKSKNSTNDYNMDNDNFMNYAISTAIDELHEGLSHLDTVKPACGAPPSSQSVASDCPKVVSHAKKYLESDHDSIQANLGIATQMDYLYDRDALVEYRYDDQYPHDDGKTRNFAQNESDPRRLDSSETASFSYSKPPVHEGHTGTVNSNKSFFSNILGDKYQKHKYYSVSHGGQNSRPNDAYGGDHWRENDRGYEGNSAYAPPCRDDCSDFNAEVPLSNEDLAQAFQTLGSPCSTVQMADDTETTNDSQYHDASIDFQSYNLDASSCFVSRSKGKSVRLEGSPLPENNFYDSFIKVKKLSNISDRPTVSTVNHCEISPSQNDPKVVACPRVVPISESSSHLLLSPKEKIVDIDETKIVLSKVPETMKTKASRKRVCSSSIRDEELKKCDICSDEFSSTKQYYAHMKIHFSGPKFTCDTCESTFNRIYDLISHRVSHGVDKKYHCDQCAFKSHREFNLKEHMTIHTNDRPYTCEICDAKFSRNQFLSNHLKKHSGEKLFQCVECDWRGNTQDLLRDHIKKHSDDLLKCGYDGCSYKTAKKSHMTDHLTKHSKSKEFICAVCRAEFSIKAHLLRHSRKHGVDNLISCNFCEYSCTRKDALQRHVGNKHKDKTKNASNPN